MAKAYLKDAHCTSLDCTLEREPVSGNTGFTVPYLDSASFHIGMMVDGQVPDAVVGVPGLTLQTPRPGAPELCYVMDDPAK